MQLLIVLALVFASFVALFALQNAQTVPIRIFAWGRETSVAVIVLATAAVGAMSAVLAGFVRQIKAGIRFRQLRAELAKTNRLLEEERRKSGSLESELEALKAKAMADGSPSAGALDDPAAGGAGEPPERGEPEVAGPAVGSAAADAEDDGIRGEERTGQSEDRSEAETSHPAGEEADPNRTR